MALNAPYTPNTVIQSTQVSNDITGLANGTNDTTNNSMSTYRSESNFDYFASGCVWSGDSYAVTRNGSQTSGVVYIAGVRLPVGSVSAHLFTASKDTYVDINGSGVQVYTEATNNAASPALAAGSVRLAIIVTGATTIAAAGSVNQGQETRILPIASSIAYAVTDSLGNLIFPCDINRKLLGYRTVTGSVAGLTNTSLATVAGLTCPVNIPTNRKVKVTCFMQDSSNSSSATHVLASNDSTAAAVINEANDYNRGAGGSTGFMFTESIYTPPASGARTFTFQFAVNTGSGNVIAASTAPAFIKVELD